MRRGCFVLMCLAIMMAGGVFLCSAERSQNFLLNIFAFVIVELLGGFFLYLFVVELGVKEDKPKKGRGKMKEKIGRLILGLIAASYFLLTAVGYLKGWFKTTDYQPSLLHAGICLPFAVISLWFFLPKKESQK